MAIAVLGALNFAVPLEVLDPDSDDLHVPGLFAALQLLLAASLLLLVRDHERPHHGSDAGWTVLAGALALLALEELSSLHKRLARGGEAAREPLLAAFTAAGASVWLGGLRLLRRFGATTSLLAGLTLWVPARALGWAVPEPGLGLRLVRGLLEMAAAAAWAVATMSAAQESARRRDGRADPAKSRLEVLASGLVREANARRLATAVAVAVLGLTLVGTVVTLGELDVRMLDPNAERNLPTFFSAALLACAAGLAYLTGRVGFPAERLGLWFRLAGIGFAVLAGDEVATVHEELQAKTGVEPGQVFLLPVAAALVLAGAVILWRVRHDRPVRLLLVGGALGWGLSQALDPLHTEGGERAVVVAEELLEMTASALFALAFLLVLKGALGRRPSPLSAH